LTGSQVNYTLSTAEVNHHQIKSQNYNGGWETIGKEVVIAYLKVLHWYLPVMTEEIHK
jgi:hypothetical protein